MPVMLQTVILGIMTDRPCWQQCIHSICRQIELSKQPLHFIQVPEVVQHVLVTLQADMALLTMISVADMCMPPKTP